MHEHNYMFIDIVRILLKLLHIYILKPLYADTDVDIYLRWPRYVDE